jgi:hypothetical protein
MTKILDIIAGDAHVGHLLGLASPVELPDGKTLTSIQRWLFDIYNGRFLPAIRKIIKEEKPDYIHGLLGGDMGDKGTWKRHSNQYWSRNPAEIKKNAVELLEPFVQLCDSVHVLRGTPSHTGVDSNLDEMIGDDFDNVVRGDHASHYRIKYENLLNALASEIVLERAKHNRRIPDVRYSFHYHWIGISNIWRRPICVAIPSWQFPADYVHGIDAVGREPEFGGVVAIYEDDEVRFKPLPYIREEDEVWTPPKSFRDSVRKIFLKS